MTKLSVRHVRALTIMSEGRVYHGPKGREWIKAYEFTGGSELKYFNLLAATLSVF